MSSTHARQRLPSAFAPAQVMTVLGPIPVEDMGVTLMHEHILLDGRAWWKRPCCASDDRRIAEQPVHIEIIGELRMNPSSTATIVALDDSRPGAGGAAALRALGGHTVVDPTNLGIGRDPAALARIARAHRPATSSWARASISSARIPTG